MGNPRFYKITSLSIPDDKIPVFEEFKKIAQREGKSFSALLVEVVEEYVKKHAEGNPVYKLDKWVDNREFVAFPSLGEPARPSRLRKLPPDMLKELVANARTYLQVGESLTLWVEPHKYHKSLGYKEARCPYCQEEQS